MSTFTAFPELPPELRVMIWKVALANEAHDRVALVHRESLRIVPSKLMISPLLEVNCESRKEALRHYSYRLDILNVPAPQVELMTYDKYRRRLVRLSAEAGPEEIGIHTKRYYWEKHAGREMYRPIKSLLNSELDNSQSSKAGCVYLSLKNDKFLLSFTDSSGEDCCVELFSYEKKAEMLGSASLTKYQVQQRHMSVRLSPGACRLVANVVHCPSTHDPYPKPWPGKIWHPSNTAMDLWMAHYFHHMRSTATSGGHHRLERFIKSGRSHAELANVILQEGGKSLVISQWKREYYHKDPNGWRIMTRFVPMK
ncbi:hypothetical protein PGQ11_010490 [Apiospora arundinis]|uniref:2EXR domain-containing protein n=1 Tax=Apiospora arundinis TaxID=335852 RepID=A0ABR2I9Y1_9PEZI